MKKIKLALPILLILTAITVSAFSIKKPAAPKVSYYWYKVTYNSSYPSGAILSSADFYVQDQKANVSSPCDPGAVSDCLRGFSSQLSSFPSTSSGADRIQKP
jgi:hypothetical protein